MTKVLAVASQGGHWIQLRRVTAGLEDVELVFATTWTPGSHPPGDVPAHLLRDATRWSPLGCLRLAWEVANLVRRERPDVVITTGAAAGLFAVAFGRLRGARTLWLDSLANVERLSLSGRLAGVFSHAVLTQWPHLARRGGPEHWGAVL